MISVSVENQSEIIEAFSSTSRYLDDLLNIDNTYFDDLISQIYPPELQLNKVNSSDTEAALLDLHLSIVDGFVSCKIYNKRDDFDFEIVTFPFLGGDVPRMASYGVYFSQLIRFARVSSHVTDFNTRNKLLTAKLFNQSYRYHKLRKKKVREKSRECHNHKPQPFPDPKRKRKPTNPNKHKSNKRAKSTKISSLFPKRDNRNTKRTEKHKNKMTHGKTYNKSPRRINHKATKSKTNTGTTAF